MLPARRLAAALVCAAAWASACSRGAPAAAVRLSAVFPSDPSAALGAADVQAVTLTLSAPDLGSPLVFPLAHSGATWGGTFPSLPAGEHRTFRAVATDASGAAIFAGEADDQSIAPGTLTQISIVLRQLTSPPPWIDAAPHINYVVASAAQVPAGQALSLQVNATDLNPVSALQYAWSITPADGTFSAPAAASTLYTPDPARLGQHLITIRVSDAHGVSDSAQLPVLVLGPQGAGQVGISFDLCATVGRIDAAPARVSSGQPLTLAATLENPSAAALTLAWSVAAPCSGTFSAPAAASTGFAVADPLTATACTFTLSLADAQGCLTSGSLTLPVAGLPPPTLLPPSIAQVSPATGAAVGDAVTVTGTNFGGVTAVTFNGTPQPAFSVDPGGTLLTTTVPAGATSGKLALTNLAGTASVDYAIYAASPVQSQLFTDGPAPANGVAPVTLTVLLRDGTGSAISGATVLLAISGAAQLSASSCTTGDDGACSVTAISSVAGGFLVSASGPVALSTQAVFTQPSTNPVLGLALAFPDLPANSTAAPPGCLRAVVSVLADGRIAPAAHDVAVRLVHGGPLGTGAFYADAACTQETRAATIAAQAPSAALWMQLWPAGGTSQHALRAYAPGYLPALTSLGTTLPAGLALSVLPQLTYAAINNGNNPQPSTLVTPSVSISLAAIDLPGGAVTDFLPFAFNGGPSDGAVSFSPASESGSFVQQTSSNEVAVESGLSAIALSDTLSYAGSSGTPATIELRVHPVGELPAIDALAFSDSAGCASTSGGVRCWGQTQDLVSSFLATPMTHAPAGAHALRLSGDLACALASDGTPGCFGIDDTDPGQRGRIDGNPGATAVFATRFFNCAATSQGKLACIDTQGQDTAPAAAECSGLAQADCEAQPICVWFTSGCYKNEPTLVDFGAPVDDLTDGFTNAFRVMALAGGSVFTWGYNGSNNALQLGPIPTPSTGVNAGYVSVPQQIPGLSGVTRLAFDGNVLCTVAAGALSCWHDKATGPIAAPAPLDAHVLDVALVAGTQCALRDDGTVWCFTFDSAQAVQSIFALVGQPEPAVALAHADGGKAPGLCALTATGRAFCWGYFAGTGQLVLGTLGLGSMLQSSGNAFLTAPVTVLAPHACGEAAYWDGAACRCSLPGMTYEAAQGLCHPDCGPWASWDPTNGGGCSCRTVGQATSASFDYDEGLCTFTCDPNPGQFIGPPSSDFVWSELHQTCGCVDPHRVYDRNLGCIYSCGNGAWDAASNSCDCATGFVFSQSAFTCVVDFSQVCQGLGGVWDAQQQTCACPGGQQWDGMTCVCPAGTALDPISMTCQ